MGDRERTYLYKDKKETTNLIVIGEMLDDFFGSHRKSGQLTEQFIEETTDRVGEYFGELSFLVPELEGYGKEGNYFFRSVKKRQLAWYIAKNSKKLAIDIDNDSALLQRMI